MTKWGKFLRFFGLVREQELDWLLHRTLQFRAERRNWEVRLKLEREGEVFEDITDLWCDELLSKFPRTRIAKVHGWHLAADYNKQTPQYIQLRLRSATVDVEHIFKIWVYDVDAFLKACDGKGGLNLDEANWMLGHISGELEKDANKSI